MGKAFSKAYLIVASLLAGLAASNLADAKIAGTPHDLGGGICENCHTPATNGPSVPPLWTRQAPEKASFKMYDSPSTLQPNGGRPHGVSLVCLACHDGVTSYNSLLKSTGGVQVGSLIGVPVITGEHGSSSRHPVSVAYNPRTAGAVFNTVTADMVGGILPIFDAPRGEDSLGQIECASCHNPHDMTFGTYLRMDNDRSAMCLTCHNK